MTKLYLEVVRKDQSMPKHFDVQVLLLELSGELIQSCWLPMIDHYFDDNDSGEPEINVRQSDSSKSCCQILIVGGNGL